MEDIFSPFVDLINPVFEKISDFVNTGLGEGEFYARFILWIIIFSVLKIVLSKISDSKGPKTAIAVGLSLLGVVGIPAGIVQTIFKVYSLIFFIAFFGFLFYLLYIFNKKIEGMFGQNNLINFVFYIIVLFLVIMLKNTAVNIFPQIESIFSLVIGILFILVLASAARLFGGMTDGNAEKTENKFHKLGLKILGGAQVGAKGLAHITGKGLNKLKKVPHSKLGKNLARSIRGDFFNNFTIYEMKDFLGSIYVIGGFLSEGQNLKGKGKISKSKIDNLENSLNNFYRLSKSLMGDISRIHDSNTLKKELDEQRQNVNNVLLLLDKKNKLKTLKDNINGDECQISDVSFQWNSSEINNLLKKIYGYFNSRINDFYSGTNFNEMSIVLDIGAIDEERKRLETLFRNDYEHYKKVKKIHEDSSKLLSEFSSLNIGINDNLKNIISQWMKNFDLDSSLNDAKSNAIKLLNQEIKRISKSVDDKTRQPLELLKLLKKELSELLKEEKKLISNQDNKDKRYYLSLQKLLADIVQKFNTVTDGEFSSIISTKYDEFKTINDLLKDLIKNKDFDYNFKEETYLLEQLGELLNK